MLMCEVYGRKIIRFIIMMKLQDDLVENLMKHSIALRMAF